MSNEDQQALKICKDRINLWLWYFAHDDSFRKQLADEWKDRSTNSNQNTIAAEAEEAQRNSESEL